ncbi:RmlC-like cupin domain-containing protein [Annulohypoxylon truncatum]|uniref:RmlC-like cupin domain-containing protein n=1 Tax=Annulohypoxylon truncatum TaxID=327061 RepID=UPI0020076309|nr:RmlC-like cupin domain-containing protein [Annulohypoxylon truncatum]KAI1213145.1 RmlC-like cupin domain-containing protein [Annulohypoxylon truncatum]
MRFNSAFLGPLGLLIASPIGATTAYPNSSIPIDQRSAAEVVAQLNLIPNDEKGYYLQTFEDPESVIRTAANGTQSTRSASTLIYYLLEGSAGSSYWHRVDAVEVWHYYAGAPLTLSLSRNDGAPPVEKLLGPDVFDGQQPQVPIPKGTWQSALSHGAWTLVGTTVAPGFVPDGVELAPPGWEPNGA